MRSTLIILCVTFLVSGAVVTQAQEPSLDNLIAVVHGEDSIKSAEAIREIGKRKPTSDLAIQTLVSSLTDDRPAVFIPDQLHVPFPVPTVGSSAADALGEIGKPAVSRICEFLEENDETMVRIHAAEAIASISPETAESRLLKMFKDEDALVRASVIKSLGTLRNASPRLLNSYIAALDDSDPDFGTDVRHAAAVALGNLKEKAVAAIPRLTRLAEEEESEWVKNAAVNAVQQIIQGQADREKSNR